MGNQVRNTAKLSPLENMMETGPVGGIEQQESRGQRELVNSDVLPAEIHGERQTLENAGVIFGEPVEGDPLFINVTLPDGWKKWATGHSMWSSLVDSDGNERARIFYKAAFYDRSANMGVSY